MRYIFDTSRSSILDDVGFGCGKSFFAIYWFLVRLGPFLRPARLKVERANPIEGLGLDVVGYVARALLS